jgi:hypothetical protein
MGTLSAGEADPVRQRTAALGARHVCRFKLFLSFSGASQEDGNRSGSTRLIIAGVSLGPETLMAERKLN